MVTLLLGSAVVVNINDVDSFSDPSYVTIFWLIIATYVATVVYAIWIRRTTELRTLAYVQFVGDALLSGGLIFVTGGAESIFLFLFFLTIVSAANMQGRDGGLFAASACSVAYALIILTQSGQLPGPGLFGLLLDSPVQVPTYTTAVNIIAFYAVAVLAGHLAERLGQFGTELEMRYSDIRNLEALNQNVVNSIAAGLCTLDLRGRIIAFNRGASRLTGMTASEVFGRPCDEVLPPLAREVDRFKIKHTGTNLLVDVEFEAADGQIRFLGLSVAALHDASGRMQGHILYFTDVTALRRLQAQARQQERLAAIGQLAAAIAHEIRNPLASISGSIQVLQGSSSGDDKSSKLMAIVLREVDRLNDLVEEFLDYARPRDLRVTDVDLFQLIEETASMVQQDSEHESVVFRFDNGGERPRIRGDEGAIRQVLWNLLKNAAEAVEGKGEVRITSSQLFAGVEPAPHIELCISDDGPGLDPEARGRLFEPFFTTKKNGTGLGLATVHRIVEAHSGVIWVDENQAESGLTFRLLLPTG
jgi:two-component system sensor histidine kinase PilS (NtrC family)